LTVPTQPDLSAYSVDGITPASVEAPRNRAELAALLRRAAADKLAVFPRGGGTQAALGNPPDRVDLVIDLTRMYRVLDYQPADMTVTVESGISLDVLQEELATAGQYVPLEAPFPERATIGGLLSTGSTGPLAHAYGPPRDWLIGIGVAGADGVETKAGGKVVKNVTGYDLNKLYTGALGTLGIIVEATLKVAPLQPESGALVGYFPSLDAAIKAGTGLLDLPAAPMAYVATCPQRGRPIYRLGHESSELAYFASRFQPGTDAIAAGFAFYSGRAQAAKRRIDDSTAFLKQAGAVDVSLMDSGQADAVRQWLTDMAWDPESPPTLAMKIAAPRRSIARLAAACLDIDGAAVVADPGFGALRLLWWNGPGGESLLACIRSARDAARAHGGTAVVEQLAAPLKDGIDVWGEEPDSIGVMRRIKKQFDPAGLLNPGRFIGGL
jgi:glycolate oxidase FAD binding subunit